MVLEANITTQKLDSHLHKFTFACIDVETANCERDSICQIGLATVRDGSIAETWSTLVNPQDWFDPWNEGIHGISEAMVADAPTFPQIRDDLYGRLSHHVAISHTSFDRVAIERAAEKHYLDPPYVIWLDSARIARRAWPDRFGQSGYGLGNVARELGIDFRHHDALEDARAAAEVVLRACAETGLDIDGWLERVKQPISGPRSRPRTQANEPPPDANQEGPLFGEHIVFTGQLSIQRTEAARIVAGAGCKVQGSVTKKTTLLVVGVQDKKRLAGYDKSTKHRKAEGLITKGQSIEILSESDFWAVFKSY